MDELQNDEQHEQPDEQPERANTATVRAWRFTNRKKLEAARDQKLYEKSDQGKLARYWQKNFDKLTPDEQAVIRQQHERATDLLRAITSTIAGIADGKVAGESMCYPDVLYADVKVFLVEYPPIKNWMHRDTAAMTPDDLDNCDDQAFRDFGVDTRLPDFLVEEFKRHCLNWCERNPDLADAEVVSELRAIVKTNIPPLTSTPTPGFQQSTSSEELALQRHNRHVEATRRAIETSRRVPDA